MKHYIRTNGNPIIVMELPLKEANGYIRLLEEAGKAIRDGRIVGTGGDPDKAADEVDILTRRLRTLQQELIEL